MPLLELRILEIHSFPEFSPTRFAILSLNFVFLYSSFDIFAKFDFLFMDLGSSSNVVDLSQFL